MDIVHDSSIKNVEAVFSLASCILQECKNNKYKSLKLSGKAISLMFEALEKAIDKCDNPKSLEVTAVFKLISEVWEVRNKVGDKFVEIIGDEIYWIFIMLGDAINKCNNPESLDVTAVFKLVSEVWEAHNKVGDEFIKLTGYTVNWIFRSLAVAIDKCNNPKNLEITAVFRLVSEVWEAHNKTEDKFIESLEKAVNRTFEVLRTAINRCNNPEKLEATVVLQLIGKVWDGLDNLEPNEALAESWCAFWTLRLAIKECTLNAWTPQNVFQLVNKAYNKFKVRNNIKNDDSAKLDLESINMMFEVLILAIEKGNSGYLDARDVFQLVKTIWKDANNLILITGENDNFFKKMMQLTLHILCLVSGIGEQSKHYMQSQLKVVGLCIRDDGQIILQNSAQFKSSINEECLKVITEVIKNESKLDMKKEKQTQEQNEQKENQEEKKENEEKEEEKEKEEKNDTSFCKDKVNALDELIKQFNELTTKLNNLQQRQSTLKQLKTNQSKLSFKRKIEYTCLWLDITLMVLSIIFLKFIAPILIASLAVLWIGLVVICYFAYKNKEQHEKTESEINNLLNKSPVELQQEIDNTEKSKCNISEQIKAIEQDLTSHPKTNSNYTEVPKLAGKHDNSITNQDIKV